MRFILDLTARADAVYDNTYHHNLRGRIWKALAGTKYTSEHNEPTPVGFCFSNPFPWGDLNEGDSRRIIISATREGLLAELAADLLDNPELNIGQMLFTIDDIRPLDPDAGPPGTTGTMRTETGVLVKVPPEYKRESDSADVDIFWEQDYGLGPFQEYIQTQLQSHHDRFAPENLPGPKEVDEDLFDGFEHRKEFAVPIEVSTNEERQFVLHKLDLDYTVRDSTHRYHLNLALDTGIGGRTTLGLGFVNIPKEANV